ncbi:MAG: hypothetical protein ACYCO3_10120 [Mycobacteriales bacterium]
MGVTVDRACLYPGQQQGLTVTSSSLPYGYVIYDTVYSNGTDALTSHYPTGSGQGQADNRGVYRTTWTLAANVPPGEATINVGVAGRAGMGQAHVQFVVASLGGSCQ